MKILIATKNPGKFKEIHEMLTGLDAEFVSLADLGITEDFSEGTHSFEENAFGKARFFHEKSGLATVADDSGIFVETLAEELGIKTRRWGAGEEASDEEWLEHFMKRMENESNRRAEFVCAAAYVSGEDEKIFKAETVGVITKTVEVPVEAGIPLSSVFKAEGCGKVFAALSTEEKNQLSHRGKAFSLLKNYVQKNS